MGWAEAGVEAGGAGVSVDVDFGLGGTLGDGFEGGREEGEVRHRGFGIGGTVR